MIILLKRERRKLSVFALFIVLFTLFLVYFDITKVGVSEDLFMILNRLSFKAVGTLDFKVLSHLAFSPND